MPINSSIRGDGIDAVAQAMSKLMEVGLSPGQADDLIGEMSHLLWAASALDPLLGDELKQATDNSRSDGQAPGLTHVVDNSA